ncbi:hypothetical protein ATY41_10060 [Leifsonia xyli subsp. xyli]|uniref:Secreted protein n=2 Tax=Leifsonia xyli TaxID=1575 RepID=A0A1E2SKC7_LEIXY|nr:hypothetical protein ATY41_10060 [Leifsonia xyli subsp. xyli]
MMSFKRFVRLAVVAIPALAVLMTGVIVAPAANAKSNYRVCGVWNSSSIDGWIGTGLVVKIYKNDYNFDTCFVKIDYMINH